MEREMHGTKETETRGYVEEVYYMPHIMYREILDEPRAAVDTLRLLQTVLPELVQRVRPADRKAVVAIGCGSSYFNALTLRYALAMLAGMPSSAKSALDFESYVLPTLPSDTLVVAFSQSGETWETVRAAEKAAKCGHSVVAVTNHRASTLGRLADGIIPLMAGEEYAAGTKSVLTQGLAALAFALEVGGGGGRPFFDPYRRDLEAAERIVRISSEPTEGLFKLINILVESEHAFIAGPGPMHPLALQAANILKEVGHIHAEALEVVEFRHGPLEYLREGDTLVLLAHSESPLFDEVLRMVTLAKQAKARVVVIGHDPGSRADSLGDEAIVIELEADTELGGSVLWLPTFHVLSYRMAVEKGRNPDQFRHIVKTWRSPDQPTG